MKIWMFKVCGSDLHCMSFAWFLHKKYVSYDTLKRAIMCVTNAQYLQGQAFVLHIVVIMLWPYQAFAGPDSRS